MLKFQPFEIPLLGLDQKTSRLWRAPGALDLAINVKVDKSGRLDKREGYALVDCTDVLGTSTDVVFTHVAPTPGDELLLFGHSRVYGIVSAESALNGEDAIVPRGWSNRGQVRATFVSQSRISQEVDDDVAP